MEQGDTLLSQKNTYAQIRFVDAGKPEGDSASFNLAMKKPCAPRGAQGFLLAEA